MDRSLKIMRGFDRAALICEEYSEFTLSRGAKLFFMRVSSSVSILFGRDGRVMA